MRFPKSIKLPKLTKAIKAESSLSLSLTHTHTHTHTHTQTYCFHCHQNISLLYYNISTVYLFESYSFQHESKQQLSIYQTTGISIVCLVYYYVHFHTYPCITYIIHEDNIFF